MTTKRKRDTSSLIGFRPTGGGRKGMTPLDDQSPTLDTNGDTAIVMRMREGKSGGGKGPLVSEDLSLTLATGNDQIVATIQRRGRGDESQDEVEVSGVHPALRAGDGGSSRGNVVAYGIDAQAWSRTGDADTPSPDANGNMRLRPPGLGVHEEQAPTLNTAVPHAVAFTENQRGEVYMHDAASSDTAGGGKPGQGYNAILEGVAVRRLTPRECERLQGFPDDWTAGQKDSARYRQMGNAVATPVSEWIARRIMASDDSESHAEETDA